MNLRDMDLSPALRPTLKALRPMLNAEGEAELPAKAQEVAKIATGHSGSSDPSHARGPLSGGSEGSYRGGPRSPWLTTLARWVAVAGGCGYVPLAPGTAGSAAGALIFVIVFGIGTQASWMPVQMGEGWAILSPAHLQGMIFALIATLGVGGVWASSRAERDFCLKGGRKDDGRIVIDEVVGQLIALAPLAFFLHPEIHPEFGPDSSFYSLIFGVVTGFVLFRLFDVWKPGAVRWAERRFDGGLGIMADDLVAGVYAAVVLIAVVFIVSSAGLDLGVSLFGEGLSVEKLSVEGLLVEELSVEGLSGGRVSGEWLFGERSLGGWLPGESLLSGCFSDGRQFVPGVAS